MEILFEGRGCSRGRGIDEEDGCANATISPILSHGHVEQLKYFVAPSDTKYIYNLSNPLSLILRRISVDLISLSNKSELHESFYPFLISELSKS